jgi:predicted RND superfamily exporter protein
LVRGLKPFFANLPSTLAAPGPIDIEELERTLERIKFKLREETDTWEPSKKPPEQEISEIRGLLTDVLARLKALSGKEAAAALDRLQKPLFQDFADKWSLLYENLDPPEPISLADIPVQLRRRFVSTDGKKFLLQIYPRKNIWEREPLEEFISQLRQVDPDVTGDPVTVYESIRAIKSGYVEGGLYATAAIILVAFLTLRRVKGTLLAMLPVVLGMLWTAGLMWLCDLKVNLANLVAVPLIVGIGIENGIHLVHRSREEACEGWALVAGSTGQSVALFSLTTMVGFGSLMVARYYGIFSMGLLLTLAVGSVLLASLTVLPLLLHTSVPKVAPAREAIPEVVETELPARAERRA